MALQKAASMKGRRRARARCYFRRLSRRSVVIYLRAWWLTLCALRNGKLAPFYAYTSFFLIVNGITTYRYQCSRADHMVSIMEKPTGLPNTKSIRKLMCDQWFSLFQIYLDDLRSFLARTRNSLVLLIFLLY